MALGTFLAVCLPYCIERQPDGTYVALNREYKPVGFFTTQYKNYEDFPVAICLKGLTEKKAREISYRGDASLKKLFLYNDGCKPTDDAANMSAYMGRLSKLAKLVVIGKPQR